MTGPIDSVTAIHNAFRKDIAIIDAAALAAGRGATDQAVTIERFRFLNEILVWHASGEELAIFPALEEVAPSVAEAYVFDHRALDAGFDALSAAFSADDTLGTARAAAAFRFHLDTHLAKEDAHLYRLIRERVSLPDQAKALGVMASTVPRDRFPETIAWMFPLLGPDDRETMTRVWQMTMPPDAFGGVKQLIQRAIGDEWAELARRIPELAV